MKTHENTKYRKNERTVRVVLLVESSFDKWSNENVPRHEVREEIVENVWKISESYLELEKHFIGRKSIAHHALVLVKSMNNHLVYENNSISSTERHSKIKKKY